MVESVSDVMACVKPIDAWQTDDGDIVFKERGRIRRPLQLPCGQCVECRLQRSLEWATRCMHEAQMHESNAFVTLTYSDENCPNSLRYGDFQRFMKRLRKSYGPVRFYMCGEYGEETNRPHFHALLFGISFPDSVFHSGSGSESLYISANLERIWGQGFCPIGQVSFESAAYCARYVMKKVTGDRADEHYTRMCRRTGELIQVTPEFSRMSLKPGIGAGWLNRYFSDVYGYTKDGIRLRGGSVLKPPRYYDSVMKARAVDLSEDIEFRRSQRAGKCAEDGSRERLKVREEVTKARLAFKKRGL